jgi:hypothetical protein
MQSLRQFEALLRTFSGSDPFEPYFQVRQVIWNDALAFSARNRQPASETGNGQLAADEVMPRKLPIEHTLKGDLSL